MDPLQGDYQEGRDFGLFVAFASAQNTAWHGQTLVHCKETWLKLLTGDWAALRGHK